MTQLTEHDARQMIAVVNTRNIDQVVEQYADDATFQVPNMDSPLRGKEAIRSFLKESFVAFPDWTLDITKVFVSGDETAIVSSVRGTHTGPLTGVDGKSIAPTHKKFVQDQMTRVVLNEKGKVKSLRAYGNPDLYRQLGLSK
ncbi:MAG TPA: ester cyclase [Thermoplasmata archaeon]|nr:ester cyclase [Thermoplasmata archaeon]